MPLGTIKEGYKYKGGDISDSTNWEPISKILDTMKMKPGEIVKVGKYEMHVKPPWDTSKADYNYVKDKKTGKYKKVE